jgi:two-component system phosphate regulon sensor histidine kinase PhoR
MMRRRLAWRIIVAYVALIVGVAAGLGGYLAVAQRSALMGQLSERLDGEARLIALAAGSAVAAGDGARADELARAFAPAIGARVTLIASDGVVLGDSEADPRSMENHADRPEVAAVLAGAATGSSTRHSATVGRDFVYVGVPIEAAGRGVGVARVARDTAAVQAELGHATLVVLSATAVAGLLATVLAVLLARRISGPVARLTRAVRALAQGDLSRPVSLEGDDEIAELGRQFDVMAARLRDLIGALSTDRARLEAVLAAMADGLLLLDGQERVVLANRAAVGLLDLPAEVSATAIDGGRRLIEMVHDHELYELVRQALARHQLLTDLVRLGPSGRDLRITATPMPGGGAGALVLVQDVTEIRRAETIRRDFAANVSHELKTPIAALKALVETLEDGALADPPVARDFLRRMHGEVDRLAQLVQELLDLARIESGRARMTFEPRDVAEVVARAVERLRPQADRAGVALSVRPSADLPLVRADAARIESVVVNLVHNAIKFTPVGGRVEARIELAEEADGQRCVRVSIADTGIGIPTDDLPRLFERFFKADKSRASSGTGLGLAIVKHVVHAHGGQVGVESELGRGSTFWLTLPLAASRAT